MQANLQNIFQKSLPTTMESEIANQKSWYAYGIAARYPPLHGWNNFVTVALKYTYRIPMIAKRLVNSSPFSLTTMAILKPWRDNPERMPKRFLL